MKTIDVIIPVRSVDGYIIAITQASIDSLRQSEDEETKFHVVVCEQFQKADKYAGVDETLYYDFPFNYNKVMNMGARTCNGEYIMFCNNDLIYLKGFAQALIAASKCGFDSLSPSDPTKDRYTTAPLSEGYGVGGDLKGECIFMTRKLFDRLGGMDESLTFWYSDHAYKDQLIENGVRHVRVTNALVIHIQHTTLKTLSKEQRSDYTKGEMVRYHNKRK